ncbi:MAG: hypothetical protein IT479_07905 [Xanthomonadales bacterium]|nr:hypothetical protein [Xanthomonadales bacterium]MCC6593184.1 hypothetical protein [Xanthomonadales bacterium]
MNATHDFGNDPEFSVEEWVECVHRTTDRDFLIDTTRVHRELKWQSRRAGLNTIIDTAWHRHPLLQGAAAMQS